MVTFRLVGASRGKENEGCAGGLRAGGSHCIFDNNFNWLQKSRGVGSTPREEGASATAEPASLFAPESMADSDSPLPSWATTFAHRDSYRFLLRAKRGGGGPPKAVEGADAHERFELVRDDYSVSARVVVEIYGAGHDLESR